MIVVIMGPAGAGKTTVGRALAAAAGWRFHDADDLHPQGNVRKISSGVPLTDADRAPWLDGVRSLIIDLSAGQENGVLACSALREAYRRHLAAAGVDLRWVYLQARPKLLQERLAARRGHFAGVRILADQLGTLEEPAAALVLDASKPVADLVRDICAAFGLACAERSASPDAAPGAERQD
jgi:gluconokinase